MLCFKKKRWKFSSGAWLCIQCKPVITHRGPVRNDLWQVAYLKPAAMALHATYSVFHFLHQLSPLLCLSCPLSARLHLLPFLLLQPIRWASAFETLTWKGNFSQLSWTRVSLAVAPRSTEELSSQLIWIPPVTCLAGNPERLTASGPALSAKPPLIALI